MSSERHNATWALEVAERRYLRGHGWKLITGRGWFPPDNFPFKKRPYPYSRGHAVNAQKQLDFNPQFGGVRADE